MPPSDVLSRWPMKDRDTLCAGHEVMHDVDLSYLFDLPPFELSI